MCRVIHRFKSSIHSKISEEIYKYDKLEIHLDKQKRIKYKNSLKTNKRVLLYLWFMFHGFNINKKWVCNTRICNKQSVINLYFVIFLAIPFKHGLCEKNLVMIFQPANFYFLFSNLKGSFFQTRRKKCESTLVERT